MNTISFALKQSLICLVVTAWVADGCVSAANAQSGDPEPYSRFVSEVTSYTAKKGKDAVGDAIADSAVKAGGVFAVVGGTYKLFDKYLTVADKAADRDAEDPFCGDQVVVLNRAVEEMKDAKSQGVDTHSPEFQAIKAQFHAAVEALNPEARVRLNELAVANESPAVYSFLMTCKSLRYSTTEVGIDDYIKDSVSAGLHKLGLPETAAKAVTQFIPVDEAIHWTLAQGERGWEKLKKRAELAKIAERRRIAAAELHAIGTASLPHSLDEGICNMCQQAMREAVPDGPAEVHSNSHLLAVSSIRLVIARQSVVQAQYRTFALRPCSSPTLVLQPRPSLTHAILVQPPSPQLAHDPFVTTIKTDNAIIETQEVYSTPCTIAPDVEYSNVPSTPEAPTISIGEINWDGR